MILWQNVLHEVSFTCPDSLPTSSKTMFNYLWNGGITTIYISLLEQHYSYQLLPMCSMSWILFHDGGLLSYRSLCQVYTKVVLVLKICLELYLGHGPMAVLWLFHSDGRHEDCLSYAVGSLLDPDGFSKRRWAEAAARKGLLICLLPEDSSGRSGHVLFCVFMMYVGVFFWSGHVCFCFVSLWCM